MTLLDELAGALEDAVRERDRVVRNASARRWKLDNPEAVRLAKAEYRRAYKVWILERDARYRETHAAQIAEYNRAHAAENRERAARWAAENKERIAARKKARYYSLPIEQRHALMGKYVPRGFSTKEA